MATTAYGITYPSFALVEMLRAANIPKVGKNVYPPDIKPNATVPRITVKALTPTEQFAGLGERWGSYNGVFLNYTFRVDVWDADPKVVEEVAEAVMYAVWKNRGYVPNSPRNTYGEFILLKTSGGSTTELNAGYQLFQRTLNITGRWLNKSQELF